MVEGARDEKLQLVRLVPAALAVLNRLLEDSVHVCPSTIKGREVKPDDNVPSRQGDGGVSRGREGGQLLEQGRTDFSSRVMKRCSTMMARICLTTELSCLTAM